MFVNDKLSCLKTSQHLKTSPYLKISAYHKIKVVGATSALANVILMMIFIIIMSMMLIMIIMIKVADATSAVANVDDYSGSARLLAATTLRNPYFVYFSVYFVTCFNVFYIFTPLSGIHIVYFLFQYIPYFSIFRTLSTMISRIMFLFSGTCWARRSWGTSSRRGSPSPTRCRTCSGRPLRPGGSQLRESRSSKQTNKQTCRNKHMESNKQMHCHKVWDVNGQC